MSVHQVLPSARRLIGSLRDVGYTTAVAVADLIDNAIDADATRVDVHVRFEGPDSWISISDNGAGMSRHQLDEAMRYGSSRDYDVDQLGKYGLGLKTASLSQCRRLTVASRSAPKRAIINVRQWDLEHVNATDKWEILEPQERDLDIRLRDPLAQSTGTVVLWERLDRILNFQRPESAKAERRLKLLEEELVAHIGMVFHRFLAGETARKLPLLIAVNDEAVAPWDPYARTEEQTQSLPPQILFLEGAPAPITASPYILPREADFSSRHAHDLSGGPKRWNQQQGFYVYRRDRLIQAGGWCRLRAEDEHTKLARVAIDIPPGAEDLFFLNVSKSRVSIPQEIRPQMRVIASTVARMSQDVYRSGHSERDDASYYSEALDGDSVASGVPVGQLLDALLTHLEDDPDTLMRILIQLRIDDYVVQAAQILFPERAEP